MIELIPEPLPPPQETKLRQWLAKPEMDLLRKVIYAKCQFAQAEALRRALSASPGDVNDLLSRAEMEAASEVDTALRMLEEIAAMPDGQHFQIARLKPHATNSNAIITEPTD